MRTATDRLRDPRVMLAVSCVAGFLLIAVLVNGQRAVAFDAAITTFVQGIGSSDLWLDVTALGGGRVLLPIGVVFVAVLLLQRRFRLAFVVAVALIGAALATELLKGVVSRPRPSGDVFASAEGYSFPSGHTLNSTVTYGLIALVVWRSGVPAWVRRVGVGALAVVPLLVGLSRIALGVHYPTDVVAGWLAGTAIVACVAVIGWPTRAEPDSAASASAPPDSAASAAAADGVSPVEPVGPA